MITPASPPGTPYGLGTIVRTADGNRWYGHSGEAAGYRFYSAVGIEPGTGVVLAANGDAGGDLIIDVLVEFGLDMHTWVDRSASEGGGQARQRGVRPRRGEQGDPVRPVD